MPRRAPARTYFEDVVLTYEGDECVMWPFARSGRGYGCLRDPEHDNALRNVHRMVCERIHGPPPSDEHEAAHSCGKGMQGCVTKAHIRWDTPAGNVADKLNHGTHNKGGHHPRALVDDGTARKILALKGTCSGSEAAIRFGVSKLVVYGIWSPQRWKHLKESA